MKKGNGNTNEIKCYLSLDELRNIIAEETARRLEPERLLGEYTKETTLLDGGRVEVTFSQAVIALSSAPRKRMSGSSLGSTEGSTDAGASEFFSPSNNPARELL